MTKYQPQRRTVAFNWHAEPFERFATDVKLPEPGSPVRFQGKDTKLVRAERIDDITLRLEVELPEGIDAGIVGAILPRSDIGFGSSGTQK